MNRMGAAIMFFRSGGGGTGLPAQTRTPVCKAGVVGKPGNHDAMGQSKNLFHLFNLFEQSLIETVHGLPSLGVVALIRTKDKVAANTDSDVRKFLAVGILEYKAAVDSAATCAKTNP